MWQKIRWLEKITEVIFGKGKVPNVIQIGVHIFLI
jgi:hypothetical protein